MLKRIRQLHISLAAKCQLLFGAAVVLIISAALYVPWQRMEQLMEQLNERAAAVLADQAVADHVNQHTRREQELAIPLDKVSDFRHLHRLLPPQPHPSDLDEQPTPGQTPSLSKVPPRPSSQLYLLPPEANLDALPHFEQRAAAHFLRRPRDSIYSRYYDSPDGAQGYRYARALYLTGDCLSCHTPHHAGANSELVEGPAPVRPDLAPPAPGQPITPLGFISIDIPSQIEPDQLLLNRLFILVAWMLSGTLAIVVFYLITTRLILHPVRVLKETAEKVSEGDLNIRSDISTGDEFEQLSNTFNTMLANLKAGDQRLRAINKNLDLKLNQLAESNLALFESNRLKSEFLANVSHELRTPLNSILGFADLLQSEIEDPKSHVHKTSRYLQNILNSAKNLLDLINDLLDLAKIEAGRMEIRSEPLSLTDLFEGLTSIIKPLAEQRQVELITQVAPNVPILHTDPAKLQQILYNFLSNAIKFSPPHETIDLTAQREPDDRVRISVTDRGPGVVPEQQEVIFEKFRQIDGSVTRQHSGSGLGLAISKELTSLLGGQIGVHSIPGHGATFWIILPLKIDPATQDLRQGILTA